MPPDVNDIIPFVFCALNVFIDVIFTNQAYFFVHEAIVHVRISFSDDICVLYTPA